MTIRSAHAFNNQLAGLDATATVEAIRSKEVDVVEVTRAAIERAESVQGELSAVATPDYERAIETARHLSVDPAALDLAFVGVPTFIKDNMDQKGLPTRQGSRSLDNASPADHDGEVVEQLFQMGMVSLGKTSLPEFGFVPSPETSDGWATHNPWNLDHTPGGSSSGSAALVAAGAVPVAHGADGGGSIRIPAACCGLVGLKVTRGRLIPSLGSKLMPIDIMTEGLLTRSVRDLALHLAEAEKLYRPKKMAAVGHVTHAMYRRLRIGVVEDVPLGGALDDPTAKTLTDTVDLLTSLGHIVEPVELPAAEQFADSFLSYWSALVYTVVKFGRQLYDKSFDAEKLIPFTKLMAERFQPSHAPKNIIDMKRSTKTYGALFNRFDLLLSPTLATLPPKLGHLMSDQDPEVLLDRLLAWMPFTPLANGTGLPAISLPLGHDSATNLPVGMMFHAGMGQDARLVEIAYELEEARPWPSLAD